MPGAPEHRGARAPHELHVLGLEAVLRRLAASEHASAFVLRGGMMSRLWFAPGQWHPNDLDFMVEQPRRASEMVACFESVVARPMDDGVQFVPASLTGQQIWEEAKHPGVRLSVEAMLPGSTEPVPIQIDISFADPVVPPPVWFDYPSSIDSMPAIRVRTVRPEVSVGWKLFGLFERSRDRWRPKDLFGIYWLSTRPDASLEAIGDSMVETFAWRGVPLAIASRLFEGGFARSRRSQQRWRKFCAEHPSFDLPADVQEVVQAIAQTLGPVFDRRLEASLRPSAAAGEDGDEQQRASAPDSGFPFIEHIDAVLEAIRGREEFRVYVRDGFSVVDYQHELGHTFPALAQARSLAMRTVYALRRECRGLIFDPQGRLCCRKFHKFFQVDEREEFRLSSLSWRDPWLVLDKLDGTLVAPVAWGERVVWTTRRGPSSIADQAEAFAQAHAGYGALVAELLDEGWTPLWEWCSRQHRIVLDHPRSRLVLTAVRHRTTGRYLDYPTMAELASRHQVEWIRSHGVLSDEAQARRWVQRTRGEREGEGYVLRSAQGQMLKVKNDRYLRLHQLLAHDRPEKFGWQMALAGELGPLLPALPPSKGRALAELRRTIDNAVERRVEQLREQVAAGRAEAARRGDSAAQARRWLAQTIVPAWEGGESGLLFDVWDGRDAEAAVRRRLVRQARTTGGIDGVLRFLGLSALDASPVVLGGAPPRSESDLGRGPAVVVREGEPPPRRVIIVGDVHGCRRELEQLLARARFETEDRLVLVGDLIDQGPDPRGVIELLARLDEEGMDVVVVQGNHEAQFIGAWEQRHNTTGRDRFAEGTAYAWAHELSDEGWALLARSWLYYPLPRYRALVVHAGIPSTLRLLPWSGRLCDLTRKQHRAVESLQSVRYERQRGRTVMRVPMGQEQPGDWYWAQRYDGRLGHVYYGHHPYLRPTPACWPHATGLDLGCVIGGALAAAILTEPGAPAEILTVEAERTYDRPWNPERWADVRLGVEPSPEGPAMLRRASSGAEPVPHPGALGQDE